MKRKKEIHTSEGQKKNWKERMAERHTAEGLKVYKRHIGDGQKAN
jgi:hypothetical protein